jgi:hypothetical protein
MLSFAERPAAGVAAPLAPLAAGAASFEVAEGILKNVRKGSAEEKKVSKLGINYFLAIALEDKTHIKEIN